MESKAWGKDGAVVRALAFRVRNSLSLKTSTSKFQFDLERSDTFQQVLKWSVGKQLSWIPLHGPMFQSS